MTRTFSFSFFLPVLIWLNELTLWLAANKLKLNVKKTKFMLFRPKGKPTDCPMQLQLNNTVIKSTNACKFLGVLCFHSDLVWGDRVNHVRLHVARCIFVQAIALGTCCPCRLKKKKAIVF